MRKWDIYLIQHSHIDVGYTHRQEVIARYHRQFLRQAVCMANALEQRNRTQESRFRFTCEGFWAVERFWESATEAERERFLMAVRRGDMELTAFYLHLTELPDAGTLRASVDRAAAFCRAHDLPLTTAMASDINGLSWPVAQLLYDVGVRYLCSNINQHHGGYPLDGPLKPFWWETHQGNRMLVWNGLPYHRANLLGLIPGWQGSEKAGIPGVVMDAQGGYVHVTDISVAEEKLTALLAGLEKQEYPFSVLPLMGSGLYTDNSPATDALCDLIARWNEKHGDHICLHSATLSEFFAAFEQQAGNLPVCRGDWTDWWSDGVASTPSETSLFRNAQRTLRTVEQLDPHGRIVPANKLRAVTDQLILYAEHTWGHSHAAETDLIVKQTFARKAAYAIRADELACDALDDVLASRGEGEFRVGQPMAWKVINVSDIPAHAAAFLPLYGWEEPAVCKGFRIVDEAGRVYPHQLVQSLRNTEICITLDMAGEEERILHLESARADAGDNALHSQAGCFLNEWYELRWNAIHGVHTLIDRSTGASLLDGTNGLGAPMYQVFPGGNRWAIGGYNFQERLPQRSEVHRGAVQSVRVTESGTVRTRLQVEYVIAGALRYEAEFLLYRELPQIQLTIKVHKQHVDDPEGLYAAFPYVPQGTWYVDKAGTFLRPGTDQIPGTCTDYYCVGDGAVNIGEKTGLSFTTLDAPLIHFDGLNLWHYSTDRVPQGCVYSWLTNNKWDTNFCRLCGGSYAFRYVLEAGAHLSTEEAAVLRCRENTKSLITVRL